MFEGQQGSKLINYTTENNMKFSEGQTELLDKGDN